MTVIMSAKSFKCSKAAIVKGLTDTELVIQVIGESPAKDFTPNHPGDVKAVFDKKEVGELSVTEVYGEYTAENVLDICYTQIAMGNYRASNKFDKRLGGSVSGNVHQADKAASAMHLACLTAGDETTKDWAVRVLEATEASTAKSSSKSKKSEPVAV